MRAETVVNAAGMWSRALGQMVGVREPADVFGGEAILRDGAVLGVTSSANFGHTVGKPIAMGYVPAAEARHSDYEIEAFSRPVPAVRHDEPLYDSKGTRQLA